MIVEPKTMHAETKPHTELFNRWLNKEGAYFQTIFKDVPIIRNNQKINKKLQNRFIKHYNKKNAQFDAFFKLFFNDEDNNHQPIFSPYTHQQLTTMRTLMNNDMPEFINFLKTTPINFDNQNQQDQKDDLNEVVQTYTSLAELIINEPQKATRETLTLALANRFFEYCFYPQTITHFKEIASNHHYHPIAKLLYATIWNTFAGLGWKNWHHATLDTLQKKCQNPTNYVTYIAGGFDILQLLNHGIFRINVIDPILPSQPKYYIEGWKWLIKGNDKQNGINDEITLTANDKNLILKRINYEQGDIFSAKTAAGKTIKIPKSITQWDIIDTQTQEKIGYVRFDRRFCTQQDFEQEPGKNLLVSFNELHFLTTAEDDNWGINPLEFPKDITLFVKQLRNPITKKIACNMRKAEKFNLDFIRLGSCVT